MNAKLPAPNPLEAPDVLRARRELATAVALSVATPPRNWIVPPAIATELAYVAAIGGDVDAARVYLYRNSLMFDSPQGQLVLNAAREAEGLRDE